MLSDIRLCSSLTWVVEIDREGIATLAEYRYAAKRVFLASQLELVRRGVGFRPVLAEERRDLFKIWAASRLAIRAASLSDGALRPAGGKSAQLEAIRGRPLAVCIGKPLRDGLAFASRGDGCGVIFEDSESRNPPRFSLYCPSCRKRKFSRELDARRRARQWREQWQAVQQPDGSFIYFARCSTCAEVFKTADVRQERCERCHSAHAKRTSAG